MTTISEPSASAMVTTTINAPPLKAATSSQTNSGADDASAPSTSKANSALLELRSLALAAAATAAAASATADARIVDAMLERFTSLVRRPSQELRERERERERERKRKTRKIENKMDSLNLSTSKPPLQL